MSPHTRDELELRFSGNGQMDLLLEELDRLPPLFGGDGLSENSPVVVNATSRALSERLIKDFISQTMGKSGVDWKTVETALIVSPDRDGHVECRVAESLDGQRREFFFDLSRSHGGSLSLLRRAYEMRVLNEAEEKMWVMQ